MTVMLQSAQQVLTALLEHYGPPGLTIHEITDASVAGHSVITTRVRQLRHAGHIDGRRSQGQPSWRMQYWITPSGIDALYAARAAGGDPVGPLGQRALHELSSWGRRPHLDVRRLADRLEAPPRVVMCALQRLRVCGYVLRVPADDLPAGRSPYRYRLTAAGWDRA